jgi:hypothetical protein
MSAPPPLDQIHKLDEWNEADDSLSVRDKIDSALTS